MSTKERRRPGSPVAVDEVEVARLRRKVKVFFDAKKSVFFARVGDERIEEKTIEACRERTKAALRNLSRLVWQPMIAVKGHASETGWKARFGLATACNLTAFGAGLSFTYQRFELARDPLSKRDLVRPWLNEDGLSDDDLGRLDCFPTERERKSEARDAAVRNAHNRKEGLDVGEFHEIEDERSTMIPYTPETWARLEALHGQFKALGERVVTMLGDGNVAGLLGAGSGGGST